MVLHFIVSIDTIEKFTSGICKKGDSAEFNWQIGFTVLMERKQKLEGGIVVVSVAVQFSQLIDSEIVSWFKWYAGISRGGNTIQGATREANISDEEPSGQSHSGGLKSAPLQACLETYVGRGDGTPQETRQRAKVSRGLHQWWKPSRGS